MIEFEIEMAGIPQPRPKARRIGPGIQIYTPNSGPIKLYKAAIVEAFKQVAGEGFVPLEGPLWLSISFVFERPATRMNEVNHIIRPDVDNLSKGAMDALNGIAWHDDSQVCGLNVSKHWAVVVQGGTSGRKKISAPSKIYIRISTDDPIHRL